MSLSEFRCKGSFGAPQTENQLGGRGGMFRLPPSSLCVQKGRPELHQTGSLSGPSVGVSVMSLAAKSCLTVTLLIAVATQCYFRCALAAPTVKIIANKFIGFCRTMYNIPYSLVSVLFHPFILFIYFRIIVGHCTWTFYSRSLTRRETHKSAGTSRTHAAATHPVGHRVGPWWIPIYDPMTRRSIKFSFQCDFFYCDFRLRDLCVINVRIQKQ